MRKLRPERYSDTRVRSAYQLERDVFEYRLETITSRNETSEFELFCRKLCERTICPNLRPQTGPEGGGDSKVDSETLPLADEIATLTYIGETNAGRERWAFAFSAKKQWIGKIRSDVAGIFETDRRYQRIICVTAQFARAKARAALEDELTAKYGIPVTIYDRSWIVKEVIEGERKDLAYNYLGVGRLVEDGRRLGPKDYSRSQQLEDIEKELSDPATFAGLKMQRAAEALVGAKLSRELERPRHETEGRLIRAIRLAEDGGTFHQKLEAHYESLCTFVWWFDEIEPVNAGYAAFEAMALSSEHATSLEFLVTLLQHLVNAVLLRVLSAEECDLANRAQRLSKRLAELIEDKERPNNNLQARTLRLNEAMIARDHGAISNVWPKFSSILKQAEGLGEFDALRLIKMIEVLGGVARDDPQYTALAEQMAAFVGKRTGEAAGAMVLLRRAKQLDFDRHFDMIRLLGRAARQLTKKEYADELIEALQLLCHAYRSAGLLWAARAGCVFALATILIESDEESQIRIEMLPTVKVWAWIALEMRHLPDFLEAVQLFNGMSRSLPLTEETQATVKEDIRELDGAFGSYVLNLTEDELTAVQRLPDVLAGLDLWLSHSALLYVLGYEDRLRADGVIPPEETPDHLHGFFTDLASQPVSADRYGPLITNPIGHQSYSSTVLGVSVEVNFDGSANGILMAEGVLGTMEAYFATAAEMAIHPHTERMQIEVIEDTTTSKPKVAFDQRVMRLSLTWPGWAPAAFEHNEAAQRAFFELSAVAMVAACVVQDPEVILKKLAEDDAVLERIAIILAAGNSYHRFSGRYFSRLADKEALSTAGYPTCETRPKIKRRKLDNSRKESPRDFPESAEGVWTKLIHNHRDVAVQSVIDVHLWDKAGWHATAFLSYGPSQPPGLALVFEDKQAAADIFKRWRARFGATDKGDEIYVSIVRGISSEYPNDYAVVVTSRPPVKEDSSLDKLLTIIARTNDMHPDSSANLEVFLASYEAIGSYVLMPGQMVPGGKLKFGFGLGLRKCALTVKQASEVGPHDIEQLAIRRHRRR
jgi:hypothetical protein